jgi:hypothetical protein
MMQALKIIIYTSFDNDNSNADLEEDITERITSALETTLDTEVVEFEYEEE